MSTSSPLLTTKLYIPPARPTLVPRPRLIACVNEGLTRPLTLISAPAGFGKTTLLSEWRASQSGRNFPLAWLSLDNDDNDPPRFLTYLVAALGALKAGLSETTLALLHSPQLPPTQTILTSLINDLGELNQAFALVLDDYHMITAQPIHDALTFILDHLPPQMHLILLTRADPPFPLARLRARDQLLDLRATDLRFTPDEASTFLNHVMGLSLSADEIATLDARTEGWIAGLQLAALSMRGQKDLVGFIRAFAGSHHYVLDYLIAEVLHRQPDRIQSFLLRTSILDRFTGPLCDAVTEQDNSAQTLEELERANLFIIPLDDQRCWYRYHHLFADLLRYRLQQDQPGQLTALHHRAADWFERYSFMEEAVRHALAAQDYELATRLMSQVKDKLWGHGDVLTLLTWFKTVPEELLRSQPGYGLSYEKRRLVNNAWAALVALLNLSRSQ